MKPWEERNIGRSTWFRQQKRARETAETRAGTAYKVESGIPMPLSFKYPFDQMQVGDSFFFKSRIEQKRIAAAAYLAGRGGERKFKTRQVNGGYRVWRTK